MITLLDRPGPGDAPVPGFLARLLDALAGVTPAELTRMPPPPGDARPAAVLMLFAGPPDAGDGSSSDLEGVEVLLLERAATLRSHSGQVAFPGGALDPGDDGPVAAALREANEETGLDPTGVEPLAVLPELYLPPSNFRVSPVLAYWRTESAVDVVDHGESARVARVRLTDLLDPANRFRLTHPSGYIAPAFAVDDLLVWGFTGGLLSTMLSLAGWDRPWDTTRLRDLAEFGLTPAPGGNTTAHPPGDRSGGHRADAVNLVDLVVVVLALLAALSGWRQGSATSLLAFTGVLIGAVLGVRVAPSLVGLVSSEMARLVVGIGVIIALVVLGETVGVFLGRAVRGSMRLPLLRRVDSALGAVVQAVAVLVAAWLIAVPLSSAAGVGLASQIRGSSVLGHVDTLLPAQAQQLPAELGSLFDTSGLPDVLGPFERTPVTEVGPPDPAVGEVASRAQASVLKVRGVAQSCSRGLEGTGFVIAPERVMTNAHVVAGTSEVGVETTAGTLQARVVSYDPEVDVAVLAVPGLTAPALRFAEAPAATGDPAVVLGYPLDGPFTASPARIREDISLRGPDIYEAGTVVRDVYTVRGQVRSGNSGGPLVDAAGDVLGVVFGASLDNDDTGFVLTAAQVASAVSAAPGLETQVSTGSCTA